MSDGKCVEDFTYTDENGSFSLPEVNDLINQQPYLLKFLLLKPFIYHTIITSIAIGVLGCLSWISPEYAKKWSQLIADTTDEKVLFKFENKKTEGYKFEALSICRWSDDFEVVEQNAYFDLSEIEMGDK